MKVLKTASFTKVMSDLQRSPGFSPSENGANQTSILEQREPNDASSIARRWKKKQRVPTEKVYQLGIEVPRVERK